MPLNIDYRPRNFSEIHGNKAMIASLKAIYGRKSDWPHAVLLQGPKGTGKTTIARIIADLLECRGNDFVEINSSNDRGINTARSIMEGAKYRPLMGKTRMYLLDEVHQTSGDFQNAMLKPLEDAPVHAYFILCTTDPSKLIPALRSRCHTFETQYLGERETVVLLQGVLKQEKIDGFSQHILKQIAEVSDGCPRDALKILDQVIDIEGEKDMEEAIIAFSYGEKQVVDLYNALTKKQGWKRISEIIKQMDLSNPESARRAMIGLAASNLMRNGAPMEAFIFDAFREPLYNTGKQGFQVAAYRAMVDLEDVVPF